MLLILFFVCLVSGSKDFENRFPLKSKLALEAASRHSDANRPALAHRRQQRFLEDSSEEFSAVSLIDIREPEIRLPEDYEVIIRRKIEACATLPNGLGV